MPCASSAASSGSISGDGRPKTKRIPSFARQRSEQLAAVHLRHGGLLSIAGWGFATICALRVYLRSARRETPGEESHLPLATRGRSALRQHGQRAPRASRIAHRQPERSSCTDRVGHPGDSEQGASRSAPAPLRRGGARAFSTHRKYRLVTFARVRRRCGNPGRGGWHTSCTSTGITTPLLRRSSASSTASPLCRRRRRHVPVRLGHARDAVGRRPHARPTSTSVPTARSPSTAARTAAWRRAAPRSRPRRRASACYDIDDQGDRLGRQRRRALRGGGGAPVELGARHPLGPARAAARRHRARGLPALHAAHRGRVHRRRPAGEVALAHQPRLPRGEALPGEPDLRRGAPHGRLPQARARQRRRADAGVARLRAAPAGRSSRRRATPSRARSCTSSPRASS